MKTISGKHGTKVIPTQHGMIDMILLVSLFGGLLADFLIYWSGILDVKSVLLIATNKIWFVATYYTACWIYENHKDIV